MKLFEYDLYLYALLRRCLAGNAFVSPAAGAPDERMLAGMLRALDTLEIGERCACGESWCCSFRTASPPEPGRDLFKIRFRVRGELLLACDRDGSIYNVEWLPDAQRAGKTRVRRYERGIGWAALKLADDCDG